MKPAGKRRAREASKAPFAPGSLIEVSLAAPREKFWGALLGLSVAGVAVCGISVESFDDFVSMVRSGESAAASQVFFPMQRVERIESDRGEAQIPSLAGRFQAATGRSAAALLGAGQSRSKSS